MTDTLDPALEAARKALKRTLPWMDDRNLHAADSAVRAYLAAAAPQAEIDRLRLMLETLVASVRSVLVELKAGESLRPAGAGKTNILVSDVNAAERILRSLHPETPNGGQHG